MYLYFSTLPVSWSTSSGTFMISPRAIASRISCGSSPVLIAFSLASLAILDMAPMGLPPACLGFSVSTVFYSCDAQSC